MTSAFGLDWLSAHPVINDLQVDKGPFGVTIVRGIVVQRDEHGNTITGPESAGRADTCWRGYSRKATPP